MLAYAQFRGLVQGPNITLCSPNKVKHSWLIPRFMLQFARQLFNMAIAQWLSRQICSKQRSDKKKNSGRWKSMTLE